MKTRTNVLILLLWIILAVPPVLAQAQPPADTSTYPAESYQLVFFLPSYRFVSTSGFAGRAAAYDSLKQSVGGEMALTFLDSQRRYTWKYRADWLSGDEYDMDSQLRLGPYFTLGIDARSFTRHLDNVPFGENLSPDDVTRTDTIPVGALFGVKRTINLVHARIKMPNAPLTLFVRGGWQARRGTTQMQYYDMGSSQVPGVCDECHSTAQFRSVNYTTRNVAAGVELKVNHVVVVYEHSFRSFNDRLQDPVDLYGSALSVPGEPLGAPDVLAGNLAHNLLSSHRTQSDTLRLRAQMLDSLLVTAHVTYGRTTNRVTGNPQRSLNADATLNWNPHDRVRTTVDYHQQNLLSEFTPDFPLFGNPSLHRYWLGVRVDYRLASFADVEAHYRRSHVTRSNADLWPQAYSPSSLGLVGTPADAFVPRLVPMTFSDTAGFALRLQRGEHWSLRSGYEWIGTHSPGYLTDSGTSHRVFVTAGVSPQSWLVFTNDFSVLRQDSFPGIDRKDRLWLNTSYLTLKPVPDWTLSLGYGYYQNNLRTDLMYGVDPAFYGESLVPFKSLSQSVSVSSNILVKKKLAWSLRADHVASHSDFRPDLLNPLIPVCGVPGTPVPCSDSVAFARLISYVNVPQSGVSSSLDYQWRSGIHTGMRFQYAGYGDRVPLDSFGVPVRPNLTGHFNTLSIFAGRAW
jgi:hypothetical protein